MARRFRALVAHPHVEALGELAELLGGLGLAVDDEQRPAGRDTEQLAKAFLQPGNLRHAEDKKLIGGIAELPRQLLQAAEAARGLGQLVERPLRLESRRAVGRRDTIKELREQFHGTAHEVEHP